MYSDSNIVPSLRVSAYGSHYTDFVAQNGFFDLQNSDRRFRLTSGIASTPKYTEFSTDTNGYLFISPEGRRINIGSTNNSSPNRMLEIHGDQGYVGETPQLRVSYNTTGYNWVDIGAIHGGGNISNSGDALGINNTSPRRTLDIYNSSTYQLRLTQADNTVYTELQAMPTTGMLLISTGNNTYTSSAGLRILDRTVPAAGHSVDIRLMNGGAYLDSDQDHIGIENTHPRRTLDVYHSTDAQIRLTQTDDTIYAELQALPTTGMLEISTGNNTYTSSAGLRIRDRTVPAAGHIVDIRLMNGGAYLDSDQDRIGIENTHPRRTLDVYNTSSPQLRLTQADDTRYVEFQSTSDGYLYIDSSGNGSGGRVGIGASTPGAMFSVGSGSGQFQVDSTGNIIKIRNVTYSWPSSNPGTDNVAWLKNDGVGNLSWDTLVSPEIGGIMKIKGTCGLGCDDSEPGDECPAGSFTETCNIPGATYMVLTEQHSEGTSEHECRVDNQGTGSVQGFGWTDNGAVVLGCTFIGFGF